MKLNGKSLDWALNHFQKVGYLNNFPTPFEFYAIKSDWNTIKKHILNINFPMEWNVLQPRKIFAPKHFYGFRLLTQLNPIDEIIFSSIVFELGEDLEKKRITKTENIVFSNRFDPSKDGRMWDENYKYSDFEKKTLELINTKEYKYIVLADIADFFPRIYKHILENSLRNSTKKSEHLRSIDRLLSYLNQNVSYGIPIGSDGSFLLAETMLDLIDRRLIDENTVFLRYVDDFRIFCKNKSEAYEKLNLLAEIIFNNLALTLQQHKTKIQPVDIYLKIKESYSKKEGPISQKFSDFLKNDLSPDDIYPIFEYGELSDETKAKLDHFNFDEIMKEQIVQEKLDIDVVRISLKRMTQTNNISVLSEILTNLEKFYPMINEVASYLINLNTIPKALKEQIGKLLIKKLNESYVFHSDYNRMWILHIFSQSDGWGIDEELNKLYNLYSDEFSKRELILAMGKLKKDYWFSSERKNYPSNYRVWERRAFLAAYSCVQDDEKKHWYTSILRNFNPDILDKSIIKWGKSHSF
jgi:hypothetical protein